MAQIQSGATADVMTVDPTSKAARVTLYDSAGNSISQLEGTTQGATEQGLPVLGINDNTYKTIRTDRAGSVASANINPLLHEPFEAAVVSVPNRLTAAVTTLVQAQTASAGLNLNSTNLTTAAGASLIYSNKRFLKAQRVPLQAKFRARAGHYSNVVMEFGFGAPASQTVSPTVGAFFQITTGGVVQGVVTFNTVDTTGVITMPVNWQDNYYTWDILMDDDEVEFYVQDTSTGEIVGQAHIKLPVTQQRLFDATHLPVFARMHNVTAPATAANLLLTSMDVMSLDANMGKPWPQVQASMGFGAEVVPTTMAQSINYANSTIPTSATLSNTAAGYTTLGGQFQFAAPVGAETDFALFGFTVPAPYSFVCTGIDVHTWNMGAVVATTAHLLQWFLSVDQTVISLATATNRRIALGGQSLAVGTVIGGMASNPIQIDLANGPAVTNSGRILVLGLKIPVGTATASQIIRGAATIKGYFE